MASKRPSFQWYPGDWQRDTALRACSLEARGLWIEMLNLMHDGVPYGHLTAGGVPITDATLSSLVGVPGRKASALLFALESHGVFSRTEAGVIYSRRMVKDEGLRTIRAESGRLGGNPNLVNQNPSKPQPLLLQSAVASASANGGKPPESRNGTGEASLLVDRIRKMAVEIPGHGKRIHRTAVEALGPDVLAAYEAIGGSERILSASGREVSFVNSEFAKALAAARVA